MSYTIFYNPATNHVQGLAPTGRYTFQTAEQASEKGRVNYYAVGACGSLSRDGAYFATGKTFETVAEVKDFLVNSRRKACKNCLKAVDALLAAEVPVHQPTADALDELIQLIEEVDAEKAAEAAPAAPVTEASLKQRRERLAAKLADVDAQLVALVPPAVDKDPITGWPIFTVNGARYAIGPVVQEAPNWVDWIKYFWADGIGSVDTRRVYADAAAGTLQRQLWDARRRYDLTRNGSSVVQVDGILYRVQAAKDTEGEPFIWYTPGGYAPRMSCNAHSPEGSVQRRIWDACNA